MFKKGDKLVNVSDHDKDIPIGYELTVMGSDSTSITFRDVKGFLRWRKSEHYKVQDNHSLKDLLELLNKAREDVKKYQTLIDEYSIPIYNGAKFRFSSGNEYIVLEIHGKFFLYDEKDSKVIWATGRTAEEMSRNLKSYFPELIS